MMKPLVTVITPVGPTWDESFLQAARVSLEKNKTPYEWILSLDGASFIDVAKAVNAKGNARIRIIGGTVNNGTAHARNFALAHAKGQWVYAMDADDMTIHGIDKLLTAAQEQKTVWAAGRAYDVDSTGKNIVYIPDNTLAPFDKRISKGDFIAQADKTGKYPFLCSGATLIKTDVVQNAGGWSEELRDVSEDVALLAKVSSKYDGAWEEDFVLAYRKHENSTTATSRSEVAEAAAWEHVRKL